MLETQQMRFEADKFACDILIPTDDFIAAFNLGLSVQELSQIFYVPIGAVVLKMQLLNLYKIVYRID